MSKILTVITTTYNSSRYLPLYFEKILNLEGLSDFQFVLVMNVPDAEEREIASIYKHKYPDLFNVVEVPERETIGRSVNRGFSYVGTPYCSFLDVDDVRERSSFLRQINVLESNPYVDFTYGDFIMVDQMGKEEGVYYSTPEFEPIEFRKNSWASPSQLFRTSILAKIGGFDEQFRSAGDRDFNIRCAFHCEFKKTPGVILYYTRYRKSQSASSLTIGRIKSVGIDLRYGYYDDILSSPKKRFKYVGKVRRYRLDDLQINGKWYSIAQFLPDGIVRQSPPRGFEIQWRYKKIMSQMSQILPRQLYHNYLSKIFSPCRLR